MDGPRATDVLANERTFLAYARTSLSFIAFGFVVARFALFTREFDTILHLSSASSGVSTKFGVAMAVFGALIALFGGYRYIATAQGLARNRIVGLSPVAVGVGALALAIVGVAVGIDLIALH
ncbi:MAG TPA: DUF202 domain-containing protein [Candidatus Baltobacteraceae bacterium]